MKNRPIPPEQIDSKSALKLMILGICIYHGTVSYGLAYKLLQANSLSFQTKLEGGRRPEIDLSRAAHRDALLKASLCKTKMSIFNNNQPMDNKQKNDNPLSHGRGGKTYR